jgi:23S rRNA U2552 (ribose-2'-O)-methylase RlmE/FtsJ
MMEHQQRSPMEMDIAADNSWLVEKHLLSRFQLFTRRSEIDKQVSANPPPAAKVLHLDTAVMDADMKQAMAEWAKPDGDIPLVWRCNITHKDRDFFILEFIKRQRMANPDAVGYDGYFFGPPEDRAKQRELREMVDRLFGDESNDRVHRVQAVRDQGDPFSGLGFCTFGRVTGRAGTKLAGLNAMCGWPMGHIYSEASLAERLDRLVTKTQHLDQQQPPQPGIPMTLSNARHCMFQLPERSDVELTYVDLCGGPGSFADYMLAGFQWTARGMGITLNGINRTYQYRNIRMPPGRQFKHFDSVDGNLCNPETRNAFIDAVRNYLFTRLRDDDPNGPPSRGVDVVLADGAGSSWKRPYDQQSLSMMLQMSELLTAVCVLRRGGTLAIKLFELFEPESVQLSYLMGSSFKDMYIAKPELSRPSNSERYLILTGFRFDAGKALIAEQLSRLLVELWQPTVPLHKTVSILALLPYGMVERNTRFRDFIVESNRELLEAQRKTLAGIEADFNRIWGSSSPTTVDDSKLWRQHKYVPKQQQSELEKVLAVDRKIAQAYPYLERPSFPVGNRETLEISEYVKQLLGLDKPEKLLVGTLIDRSDDQLRNLNVDKEGWVRPTTGRECRDKHIGARLQPDSTRFPLHGYFVSRRGLGDIHYLLVGEKPRWFSLVESVYPLRLPAGTLVYGEIVPERTLHDSRMRWTLHIIDVISLGYLSVHRLPIIDRQRCAALLVAAVGGGWMPMRVKPICHAAEWYKFIQTCTTETYPGVMDETLACRKEMICRWFPLDENTVFPVRYLMTMRNDVLKMESYAIFPYKPSPRPVPAPKVAEPTTRSVVDVNDLHKMTFITQRMLADQTMINKMMQVAMKDDGGSSDSGSPPADDATSSNSSSSSDGQAFNPRPWLPVQPRAAGRFIVRNRNYKP